MSGEWSFLIMAAGSGSRLGGTPKQFRTLGRKQVWVWSLDAAYALYRAGRVKEIAVVLPHARMDVDRPIGYDCPIIFVEGGQERSISALNGLRACSCKWAMIHDAARPFISTDLCIALMDMAERSGAAVPIIPSVDSLKEMTDDSFRVVDRSKIFRTQTPQCFERARLIEAIERAPIGATDEASVWSELVGDIEYVQGDEKNFKITAEFDWQVASSLVAGAREIRTGHGYDVHELVPGRALVLGGVRVDSELGLLGHSDADLICHSISDALLGAAGAGDIGTIFPASDDRYKDADSMLLMEDAAERVRSSGWSIVWIDVTLAAQTPKLASSIPIIKNNLARVFTRFGLEDKLSVKVKSGERVGAIGRGECMVCYTVATLERYTL